MKSCQVDAANSTHRWTLPHQTRPYGWEGFRSYNITYLMRAKGLNFQGANALYVSSADYLMLIELKRQQAGDLEIGMADLSEEYSNRRRKW
mmetsp:Transcript_17144/g.52729  ORF Transcript_17144/g.52729 Transcript_17144/m.52729 type:complete len:91 (+) Transcript_17144:3609-3881(+)